ncbi:MAG: hypothetical protein DBX55_00170 [Verrucomicrobia bacterium]|nr:MAG: hypothetical protein DBX55_00170 [Verrucomicrobiota bacterium]
MAKAELDGVGNRGSVCLIDSILAEHILLNAKNCGMGVCLIFDLRSIAPRLDSLANFAVCFFPHSAVPAGAHFFKAVARDSKAGESGKVSGLALLRFAVLACSGGAGLTAV